MTASKVLFDTWAWWEVLRGTKVGAELQREYLDAPGVQVLTSAVSLGELSAKLSSEGDADTISTAVSSIRRASAILDLTAELAVQAGILRTSLRRHAKTASLADGIVLATAQQSGAQLVSNDGAFSGEPDVTAG